MLGMRGAGIQGAGVGWTPQASSDLVEEPVKVFPPLPGIHRPPQGRPRKGAVQAAIFTNLCSAGKVQTTQEKVGTISPLGPLCPPQATSPLTSRIEGLFYAPPFLPMGIRSQSCSCRVLSSLHWKPMEGKQEALRLLWAQLCSIPGDTLI